MNNNKIILSEYSVMTNDLLSSDEGPIMDPKL